MKTCVTIEAICTDCLPPIEGGNLFLLIRLFILLNKGFSCLDTYNMFAGNRILPKFYKVIMCLL